MTENIELEDHLSEIIARIEELAHAEDPAFGFVSKEFNPEHERVYGLAVYRAAEDPAALSELYATVVPPELTMSYGRTLLSEQQIRHLTELVLARTPQIRSAGIRVSQFGGIGFTDHGGRFEICYDPEFGAPGPELIAEFEVHGPDTVVWVPGVAYPA